MAYKTLLEYEQTQIGVHNDPDGSNKYCEWFYGYRAKEPWCAIYQTYGCNEVGIYDRLNGLIGKAGCENWRKWAIAKGYWSTKPKVGAFVLYDWNPKAEDGADHIGLVESIFDGGIVAIEGNTGPDGASQTNGGWVLRKRRYNDKIMGYIHMNTNAPQPKPQPVIGYTRYAGVDRYNTSKATVNTFNGKNTGITLVSGTSYADALSASYFARQKNAPILLTSPAMMDDTVKYITERKNIKNVFIIGGEGVIPAEIEKKLEGYNITRLAGKTRYETNLAVLGASSTPNKQLIVASGQNFPDGLCAGTINRPVLLVNTSLKEEALTWIKERGLTRFYIFGGESVVNNTIFEQLSELGETTRYAGANRYETSKAIAKYFFPKATHVLLASGKSYPDALSASNLGEYPLLLVDNGATIEARKYISGINIQKADVVGGTAAVSDDTAKWALTPLEKINA